MANKTTTQTLEFPLTERHILDSPASTTGSACILGVNFNQLSTSFLNFVRQHLDKVAPRDIVNASCKIMIFNHISNLQFFNRNDFELFDDGEACFMKKVLPLIEDSLVNFSNFKSGFSPILTSFFLPAQSPLKSGKFLFRFSKELRIFNLSSIGKNGKTFNSNINPNMVIFSFNLFNRNIVTGENNKPSNSSSFNCESLEFPFWNFMKDNRNISDFADKEFFIREQFETRLGGKLYFYIF